MSEVKAWAYSYDANFNYAGPVARQESPNEPGVFLVPASSTPIRPVFREGFVPRWNPVAGVWDLVPKKSSIDQAVEREAREQKHFENIERNLRTVFENENKVVWTQIKELSDKSGHMLQNLMEAIQRCAAVEINSAKRLATIEDSLVHIMSRIESIEREIHSLDQVGRELMQKAHVQAGTLAEHEHRWNMVSERVQSVEATQNEKGFWSKLFGG